MLFHNQITDEYAILFTEESFSRWSAEMDISLIQVRDDFGSWWRYTDFLHLPWNN